MRRKTARSILINLLVIGALMSGFASPGWTFGHNKDTVTPKQAAVVAKKQQAMGRIAPKLEPPAPVELSEDQIKQLPTGSTTQLRQQAKRLQERHQGIEQALGDDQDVVIQDLTFLWQAAVERSAAIRYAVEKLGQRDASGKPVKNDGNTRRLLTTIAQLGGAAGSMWTGTPIGLLGGSMVSQVINEARPTGGIGRVTDADMVILAKAVEDLQRDVMTAYYQYRYAQERLALADRAVTDIQKHYSRALTVAQKSDSHRNNLEVLLRSAMAGVEQEARQSESEVHQTCSSLALLVGSDVIAALELQKARLSTTPPDVQHSGS